MNRYRLRPSADRLLRLSAEGRAGFTEEVSKKAQFQKFSFHIESEPTYEKAFKENKISIVKKMNLEN